MELLSGKYLPELLAVVSITLLTVITPGPDFMVVARNSLSHSQRSGIFTAIGVACAVWIHIFYTLAGIGLMLAKSILLFAVVKYLGATYLIYLGIHCLKSGKTPQEITTSQCCESITGFGSFRIGFINNALNPKATLFFVSVFTQLVSPTTPLRIQLTYGAIVSLSCLLWFTLVAIFLNQRKIKTTFFRTQKYVEKFMGAVLITFGLKIAFSATR